MNKLNTTIKIDSPNRVVINSDGMGCPPKRAREKYGINPDIIFIRRDGWTLAAPTEFENIAYQMWKNEWIAFLRKPETKAKPMSEY